MPQHPDLAGVGFQHATKDAEGGGLTRSISSDQAEDFALAHLEIDRIQGLDRTVTLGKTPRRDHGRHHDFPWTASTCTRASAGMPGLAAPSPPFRRIFSPTTCFT